MTTTRGPGEPTAGRPATSPWHAPGERSPHDAAAGTAYDGPYGGPGVPESGGPHSADDAWRREHAAGDVAAGLLTAVLVVLLGAPVGLLWGSLAPRVDVVLSADGPGLASPETKDFIAADGVFLLLVLAAGAVCGVVGWLVGRRWGPGVVLGLLVGGLAAAWVASRTGSQVGREAFLAAVHRGQEGATVQGSIRLRAAVALVGWPVGALAAFVGMAVGARR